MEATRHPSYPEEKKNLQMTLQILDSESRRLGELNTALKAEVEELFRASGGEYNQELVNKSILLQGVRARVEAMPFAQNKPYFARLDFKEDGREIERLYLGKLGVPHNGRELIVDWRAPIANIYYSGQMGRVTFKAPSRILGDLMAVRGDLLLKRQFIMDHGKMHHIFDRETTVQDELLQAVLESGTDQRLKEVVSTIQAEQNAIIRADKDQILIVQGVAGSGKTTVALHRLAYLIYTYQQELPPDRIWIVGPNALFLTYISEVLPELGVNEVRQTTFEHLAQALIGQPLKVEESGNKLQRILDGTPLQDTTLRLVRFKGSLAMKRTIDGYVRHLETRLLPPCDLALEGETVATRDELQEYLSRECFYLPLMARAAMIRNYCQRRLKERSMAFMERAKSQCDLNVARLKSSMPEGGERRWRIGELFDERDRTIARLKAGTSPALKRYMSLWPDWTLLDLYRTMLDEPEKACEWSDGAMTPDRASEYAPAFREALEKGVVGYEDLAPLIHLFARVFGLKDTLKPYHIVIDEAQDLSQFQFAVLRDLSPEASFTIVGDLAQGIHAYRSIRDWTELTGVVFPGAPSTQLGLTKSYRSATEIMMLANEVIAALPRAFPPADPVLRHCPKPRIYLEKGQPETITRIGDIMEALLADDCKSVAVIGRTARECKSIHRSLSARFKEPVQLITERAVDYEGRLVVVPVFLAKGLEFDGVIIPDVSDKAYTRAELDVKLLYVACTRAMHRLAMVCPGAESPVISGIGDDVVERIC